MIVVACRWPGAISASLVFTAIGLNSRDPQELTAHVWRLGILEIEVFDNRAAATSSMYDAAHLFVLGIQVAYPESCAQRALRVLLRGDESHVLDLATVAGASKCFRLLRSTSDIIRVKYYSSMTAAGSSSRSQLRRPQQKAVLRRRAGSVSDSSPSMPVPCLALGVQSVADGPCMSGGLLGKGLKGDQSASAGPGTVDESSWSSGGLHRSSDTSSVAEPSAARRPQGAGAEPTAVFARRVQGHRRVSGTVASVTNDREFQWHRRTGHGGYGNHYVPLPLLDSRANGLVKR